MSRQINQPSNVIKLTNVSLVRLKKGKKRFEIACYKNKVVEWRDGIETNPDEVLQIPSTVFLNVSKGQTAPRDDLDRAFGKGRPVAEIVLEILNTGEIQVGDKERAAQLERVRSELVAIVAARLVDPRTKRVYTTGMIEKALDMLSQQAHAARGEQQKEEKSAAAVAAAEATTSTDEGEIPSLPGGVDIVANSSRRASPDSEAARAKAAHVWTGVVTTRSAKSQALDAMKALIAHQPIPVARARMRLRVTCALSVLKQPVKGGSSSAVAAAAAANGPQEAAAAGGGGGGGKGKKGKKDKHHDKQAAAAAAPPATTVHANDDDDDGTHHHHKAPGTVKDKILSYVEQVESQDTLGNEWEVVGFVEPGAYKTLADFVSNDTRGQGRVEVLDMAITHDEY